MIYIDTSVIVKLYLKETYSIEAATWIKKNNQAILLTRLHDLEFINAINLKQFRNEITDGQVRYILAKFDKHQQQGIFYRPPFNWTEILKIAVDLIQSHTKHIGSRSLDILHVAAALSIKADRFLTFDDRQIRLAGLAGLEIVHVDKVSR